MTGDHVKGEHELLGEGTLSWTMYGEKSEASRRARQAGWREKVPSLRRRRLLVEGCVNPLDRGGGGYGRASVGNRQIGSTAKC